MDVSRYGVESQKALRLALQVARQHGHAFLEPEHVAFCLIKEGLVRLKEQQAILVLDYLERHLDKSPKIYGLKKIRFGRRLNQALDVLEVDVTEELIGPQKLWDRLVAESSLLKMLTSEDGIQGDQSSLRMSSEPEASSIPGNNEGIRIQTQKPHSGEVLPKKEKVSSKKSSLKKVESFVVNLTELASTGKLTPIYGREVEIQKILQILGRHKKNNPLLIGEPGVGKSALAEGVAWWLVHENPSDLLKNMHVLALDLGSLIAGTKYRGEFEERVKNLLELASEDPGKYIFFIDEAHMIIGAGNQEGGADVANLLKPALARGLFRCMAATTLEEYKHSIQKDAALVRRFQVVPILEPTSEQALKILKGVKSNYEAHHKVAFSEEAVKAAVELSVRYFPTQRLPDKAIDLLDEAASRANLKGLLEKVIQPKDLASLIEEKLGIKSILWGRNHLSYSGLENRLGQEVLGQFGAVKKLAKSFKRTRAGLSDLSHPMGSFLFFGPQGVGKQVTARCLAKEIFTGPSRLIYFDLSEYKSEGSINRLIGSPPGLVGYEEGGALTDAIRETPLSVVYFDNADKAHESVVSVLVRILETSQLTDRQGHIADFRHSVVIFAVNLEEDHFKHWDEHHSDESWDRILAKVTAQDDSEIRKKLGKILQPDLVNRLSEVILFRNLSSLHLKKIVDRKIAEINQKIKEYEIKISLSEDLTEFISSLGKKFGTASLASSLTRYVLDELSERLLSQGDEMRGSWFLSLDESGQVHWEREVEKSTGRAS